MIPRTGISVSKKELVGLLAVFIGYVLLGGAVFMLLESPLERQLRSEVADLRNDFQETLQNLGVDNVTRVDMERLILRLAAAHSNSLIDDDNRDTVINWSFENSFFFAITVVTTIGYGHLAPSTTPGRLFCLMYATFGIPLTGILLAAIGGCYSQHLVRRVQRVRRSTHSRLALIFSASVCLVPWLLVFLVLPAGLFTFTEGWTFVEGFYYCFITLSTIGFGDYVATNFQGEYIWLYKTGVVLWIIFGLGYLAMILNYISRAMRCKQVRRVERKLSTGIHQTQQKVGQRLEEVYQILQEVSRHRSFKRRAIKRMQSFPAPELRDRNHNHKIQRLLHLVQHLKEEEQPVKPRRHSLPLPEPHHLQAATNGRGSLQVFSSNKSDNLRNGYPSAPLFTRSFQKKLSEANVVNNDKHIEINPVTITEDNNDKNIKITVIDVSPEKPAVSKVEALQAVIDMEGLQCTRV